MTINQDFEFVIQFRLMKWSWTDTKLYCKLTSNQKQKQMNYIVHVICVIYFPICVIEIVCVYLYGRSCSFFKFYK